MPALLSIKEFPLSKGELEQGNPSREENFQKKYTRTICFSIFLKHIHTLFLSNFSLKDEKSYIFMNKEMLSNMPYNLRTSNRSKNLCTSNSKVWSYNYFHEYHYRLKRV